MNRRFHVCWWSKLAVAARNACLARGLESLCTSLCTSLCWLLMKRAIKPCPHGSLRQSRMRRCPYRACYSRTMRLFAAWQSHCPHRACYSHTVRLCRMTKPHAVLLQAPVWTAVQLCRKHLRGQPCDKVACGVVAQCSFATSGCADEALSRR